MTFTSLSKSHRALFLGLGALVLLGSGCRLVQTTAELPGRAVSTVTPGRTDRQAVDPVEVQQKLLRFTDEFVTRVILGVDQLRRGTNPLSPDEVLRWKISLSSQASAIASGPNAIASMLDMTVFITVNHTVWKEHWQSNVFGASAQPMVAGFQNAETDIWQFINQVIQSAQQEELREAIAGWHRQNVRPEDALSVRAVGFSAQVATATQKDVARPGSVFDLLMIDPLSGMDPAVREIAQTRLLAERALFLSRWMPTILRWQTELLSLNTMAMPEVQQLVANSTQISASVERFATVAEKLPAQVSTERAEIMKALQAQEKGVASLLSSGTQMSDSLNTTLTTFDALMQRFGVGETNVPAAADTNSAPFNILDYAQTADRLTELLRTLDETTGSNNLARISAQLTPVVQSAQTSGQKIVDRAFWKGVLLAIIVLLLALIYRFMATWMTAKKSNPDS